MDAEALAREVDELAGSIGFSGVVRVDGAGGLLFESAHGFANRIHAIGNTTTTRFAIASGSKTLTALAVVSLIEDGMISLSTTARSLLGTDLPLIADDVTVEHLLTHRSGIGDYLDEEAHPDVDEYVLPTPVHQLDTAESYLAVLAGHPTAFPAGERFVYNNGGYVVLAILAERAAGTPYHELVLERVCRRAGMQHTDFPRSDEPATDVARGYLGVPARENVLHLPVRASVTVALRRRPPTSTPCGTRSTPGGSCPPTGFARWSGRVAPTPTAGNGTESVSGSTPRAMPSSSRAWTPASRFGRYAIPQRR